ncbi:MAG: hypothetical protein GX126_12270 [Bacteroidales bacterium]|jgi:hypothetical protein|nr:hypothetical protein [Bacteroidales bacterium]
MKKFDLLLIVLLFMLMQCKASINEENKVKSVIQVDAQESLKLIGIPLKTVEDRERELDFNFEFLTLEKQQINIHNDSKKLEIIVEKIKEWNDPGDFHRIRVRSQEKEYVFFNSDGWVTVGEYETQYINSFSKTNEIKSRYVCVQKVSDKDILLFAFGYAYASQPGLLSILNLSRFGKPELIFNDNYHLYSYEDTNSDGTVDIVVTKDDKDETDSNDSLKTYLLKNGSYQPK